MTANPSPDQSPPVFDPRMAEAKVLVVDDEPGLRHFLSKALSRECARVDVAEDTQQASACLDAESYDVIILDNIMPGQSGLSWLADQRQIGLHADVIIVTAFADLRTAIEAIQAGASDFLLKPFRSNQVLNAVSKCLSRADLSRQNSLLRHELEEGTDLMRHRSHLIGSSRATQAVRGRIEEAAGIDSNTIIQGEPGTPKLISARMLHSASARRGRPFITLQCYGMTAPDLRERLFGRLTAEEDAEGLLKLAEGGMLYLEEVDQLDASCQSVLLEWAAQGRFQPIGGRRSFASDIRIICSSTVPLARAVRSGAFRADLHYILNVQEIVLPPLRERPEDTMEILSVFIERLSRRMGLEAPEMTPVARRLLMAHDWPGNVMELRNLAERAVILGSFEKAMRAEMAAEDGGETESLAAVERRHILRVLDACGGNRAEASRRLGVARKTIDRKCQAWGLTS